MESAVASISHQVTIEPNMSLKVPITTKMFRLNGKVIVWPNNTVSSFYCTESPIVGKYQTVTFDQYSKSHISIDNALDIPVTLPQGNDMGSLESVNLAEVNCDMDNQPLSAAPKSSSSLSPEKCELLTIAENEQLLGALYKGNGVSSSFHLAPGHYRTQYVSESTHYN